MCPSQTVLGHRNSRVKDNSEYSRNGDYIPSRLDVQCDAANIICGTKTNMNPENSIGLLTAAGNRITVRVTPTQDVGKILQGFYDITSGGEADILGAIQTAQLALKHRMNKNQKQRIILFVGSPIKATEQQLEKIGRVLKKNNISLDIISFGETSENYQKLTKLHETVNNRGTSHFLDCPVEKTRILSDLLMMSYIVRETDGSTLNTLPPTGLIGLDTQENRINPDIGVDPRVDPELYMALQISLLEERERQSRTTDLPNETSVGENSTTLPEATEQNNTLPPSSDRYDSAARIEAMEGIDDELRRALLLSLEDFYQAPETVTTPVENGTGTCLIGQNEGDSSQVVMLDDEGMGCVSVNEPKAEVDGDLTMTCVVSECDMEVKENNKLLNDSTSDSSNKKHLDKNEAE